MNSEIIDISLDIQFGQLKSLTWKPYIGKNYNLTTPKILVVGESHYVPDGENFNDYHQSNWTREFILKEGLQQKPWYSETKKNNLIREVEKTLLALKKVDSANSIKLWNNISYYNFIQRLMTSLDKRPTYEDIINGWKTFQKVYDILQPDIIIFCGIESSKHLVNFNSTNNEFNIRPLDTAFDKINRTYPRSFILQRNGNSTTCLFIKHPSMMYSWEPWSKILNEITNGKMVEFRLKSSELNIL